MAHNTEHLFAIRESDGETVGIFDRENVPNGNACGCICSKCKEPLQARNNKGNKRTYFAHQSDSNCSGESLVHIEAKNIIKNHKYLWLPFLDKPLRRWSVDSVNEEAKIKNSSFIADLECKIKNKIFYVEIVVTHDLEKEKRDFILDKEIPVLNIYLSEIEDKNNLPDDFNNLVLKKSFREWVYNESENKEKEKPFWGEPLYDEEENKAIEKLLESNKSNKLSDQSMKKYSVWDIGSPPYKTHSKQIITWNNISLKRFKSENKYHLRDIKEILKNDPNYNYTNMTSFLKQEYKRFGEGETLMKRLDNIIKHKSTKYD